MPSAGFKTMSKIIDDNKSEIKIVIDEPAAEFTLDTVNELPSDSVDTAEKKDFSDPQPNVQDSQENSASLPIPYKKEGKKRYDILYFLELALKNMANNIGMALASLFVLTSCLVVLGSCFLLLVNINTNLENFGSLNQIVVYCEYDAEEAEVNIVGDELKSLGNVISVTHVSKDESFDALVDEYHSYSSIFSDIFETRDNPLSDSFVVQYEDNNYVGELVYNISAIEGVRKINNRADLAIKVENFKNGVVFVFIAFFILLFLTGFFVVVNTINMALHYRRYDIIVMKYIGATNAFILSPFILEGVIIGIVASSVACIVQYLIYINTVNATAQAFGSMINFVGIHEYGWLIWSVFLAVGILCGLLGSITSIHKNLNA